MLASLAGIPSPMNAMMILFINIVMDGPPAQSLGIEPVSNAVLSAPPRRPDEPIVDRNLITRVIISGLWIGLWTLYIFYLGLSDGAVSRRDTTTSFVAFVNFDLFNAYCCRSGTSPFWEIEFLGNPAFNMSVGVSALAQIIIVYFGPAQKVFQTEGIGAWDFLWLVGACSSILWVDAFTKKFVLGKDFGWPRGGAGSWANAVVGGRDKKDEGEDGDGEGVGLINSESTSSLDRGARGGREVRARTSIVVP